MALNLTTPVTPLPYGVIRKHKDVVDGLTAPAQGPEERTEQAIAFLRLAHPNATDEDFDALSPGVIQVAAFDLYKASFGRPE